MHEIHLTVAIIFASIFFWIIKSSIDQINGKIDLIADCVMATADYLDVPAPECECDEPIPIENDQMRVWRQHLRLQAVFKSESDTPLIESNGAPVDFQNWDRGEEE